MGICDNCHNANGAAFAGGLRLDAGQAYNQLVNVPSSVKPGAVRVIPGNASDSYLIHKLEGRSDISGSRMPLNAAPLPQADKTRSAPGSPRVRRTIDTPPPGYGWAAGNWQSAASHRQGGGERRPGCSAFTFHTQRIWNSEL